MRLHPANPNSNHQYHVKLWETSGVSFPQWGNLTPTLVITAAASMATARPIRMTISAGFAAVVVTLFFDRLTGVDNT